MLGNVVLDPAGRSSEEVSGAGNNKIHPLRCSRLVVSSDVAIYVGPLDVDVKAKNDGMSRSNIGITKKRIRVFYATSGHKFHQVSTVVIFLVSLSGVFSIAFFFVT